MSKIPAYFDTNWDCKTEGDIVRRVQFELAEIKKIDRRARTIEQIIKAAEKEGLNDVVLRLKGLV